MDRTGGKRNRVAQVNSTFIKRKLTLKVQGVSSASWFSTGLEGAFSLRALTRVMRAVRTHFQDVVIKLSASAVATHIS